MAAKKTDDTPDIQPHVVVGSTPYFGDDLVLHQPGEIVHADAKTAGDNLDPADKAAIATSTPAPVEISPVAPSSPNASAPQGVPAGAKQTAGGSFIQAGDDSTDGRPQEYAPLGGNEADNPGVGSKPKT